ncbi:spore coat protein CotJB [Pseudoflavonifractor phocaeensis]|uniref:spore coat protein CotJB n=1 Tax=Pseudoflavonifractor phocaeensis TaxID=1870988 RepID=UPI0030845BBC
MNSDQENQAPVMPCADGCGLLPECAPLAVPYVPFQQTGSKRYSQQEALRNGTLFPGLNLPFHLKAEAGKVGSGPLAELQALEFVLAELGQYLDTHQGDSEAFALFQQYAALEREGRQKYEASYGPLFQQSAANDKRYTWLQDPWPWNMGEEYSEKGGEG